MTDKLPKWLDEQFATSPPDNHGRLNAIRALRAVVELHREDVGNRCMACGYSWPCKTLRAIEKEILNGS